MYFLTSSERFNNPSFSNCKIANPVNAFEVDPSSNKVLEVTGVLDITSAYPKPL